MSLSFKVSEYVINITQSEFLHNIWGVKTRAVALLGVKAVLFYV